MPQRIYLKRARSNRRGTGVSPVNSRARCACHVRTRGCVSMTAMMVSGVQRAEVLDGKVAADAIKREVASEVRHLKETRGVTPTLAAVLVGDDPASAVYVRNKVRACEEVGIRSRKIALADSTSTDELFRVVTELNRDDDVDGILVQLPLPKQIDDSVIIEAIDPAKDVDAFHPTNVGLLAMGKPRFVPCTPAGKVVADRPRNTAMTNSCGPSSRAVAATVAAYS